MDVALRVVLLVGILVVYAACVLALRRSGRAGETTSRIVIATFATAFTLGALELYYSIDVRSDGYGFTRMGRAWLERHWKPINSLGYRDREHDPASLASRRLMLVVGDSFVAGYGIVDPADRFPDLLQQRLGSEWAVVNVSGNGWSTSDELQAIRAYPVKPEAIVLSYHMNDFAHAAQLEGLEEPPFFHDPPRWLAPLLEHSFLLDGVYTGVSIATSR